MFLCNFYKNKTVNSHSLICFLFPMKILNSNSILFYGPSLLWAEFVMGRECYGPSLLWAEMSRKHLIYVPFILFEDISKSELFNSILNFAVLSVFSVREGHWKFQIFSRFIGVDWSIIYKDLFHH